MARPVSTGRLITIPPSNDCEIARWLLAWWGVPFVERPHVPVLHELVLDWYGQRAEKRRQQAAGAARVQTYPLLLHDGPELWNVRQVIEHFLPLVPEERRLLPDGGEARLWELWKPLHDDFTTAPAIWYYTLALPHRRATLPAFVAGVPWYERAIATVGYPLIAAAIRHVGKLDAAAAERAAARIDATLDDVARRTDGGRAYLTGDRFTLIDLVFAASAAPVVAAAGYGAMKEDLPDLDTLPGPMRDRIEGWRDHPAGRYVLRVYRDHRHPPRG